MDPPPVSIVIITRNRCAELCRTLETIQRLPERPPTIVVDNGSTDASVKRARTFPRTTVVAVGKNLGVAGRLLGLELAQTPYVAFADDDVHWIGDSLGQAVDVFEQFPQVALLSAKVLVGDEGTIDPTCVEMAESPLPPEGNLPGPRLLGFLAGASVARRDAILPALRAIPSRLLIGGEEQWIAIELTLRGWQLCYVDSLVARHYPSLARNVRQRQRLILRNEILFALMRRPWKTAVRRTISIVGRAYRDGVPLITCAGAVMCLPKTLGKRRVVPREIEAMLCQLDLDRERVRHAEISPQVVHV